MKTLQKAEMLKRDQVSRMHPLYPGLTREPSSPTFVRNAICWPSPRRRGWSSCSILSKTRYTSISSWSSFLEAIS